MKIKHMLCVIATVAISKTSFAQYAQDAIRFSTFQPGSTSRIKAIGNAGTAIGGDLSSIGGNPAGLGFFTRTEYSLTPEFNGSTNKASYLGQGSSATNNSVNLNNAGIVFYNRVNTPRGVDKSKGWLSVNFGIGFSRTNNFNETINYGATNNNNSITDYYASLANSDGIGQGTLAGWAYDHSLIDLYGTPAVYGSNAYAGVNQLNNINRSGGQSEINFSMGANYSNKLYLGLGLALTDLNYTSVNNFTESGIATVLEGTPPAPIDRNYTSRYTQEQNTNGTGFNAKLGLMYKIEENLRFGALFTTPTFMSINDVYSESLNSRVNNTNYGDAPSDYPLTYSMRTPLKLAGGLSYFIGKYGFITGDVEYVDYTKTRINNNSNYSNTFDNGLIRNNYRSALNAHFGAEARLTNNFSLRGGYGMQGSPLKNGGNINTFSGGLGYRFTSGYFIDATYSHVDGNQMITPYTVATNSPAATVARSNNNVFLTFGFRY